jgi:hypothetical protein
VVSIGRRSGDAAPRRGPEERAISDLLDTVRQVRTTLAIDLSAAAGALDEGNLEVARDILSATSADVRNAGPAAVESGRDRTLTRRRRRALIAAPAVPLVGAIAMTAAAALSGTTTHHGVAPATHHPVVVQHASATSTLQRLEHVVEQHARAAQVIAVADDLHEQLTQMIATSTDNPAQLHMVQRLLTLEQRVLEESKLPGTQFALAASRKVAELLKQQPAPEHSKRAISNRGAPTAERTTAPTTHPTASPSPSPAHTRRVAHPQPSPSATHASPSPQPSNGLFGQGVFNGPRSH